MLDPAWRLYQSAVREYSACTPAWEVVNVFALDYIGTEATEWPHWIAGRMATAAAMWTGSKSMSTADCVTF